MPVRYTVKQVSQLTGISTDLLRAWERRYGVVSPRRTASRYRLYGDDGSHYQRQGLKLSKHFKVWGN